MLRNRVLHAVGKAVRETGQAIDRYYYYFIIISYRYYYFIIIIIINSLGLTVSGNELFKETFARHRPIMNLFDKRPLLAADGITLITIIVNYHDYYYHYIISICCTKCFCYR
jgi:hypothetical protein